MINNKKYFGIILFLLVSAAIIILPFLLGGDTIFARPGGGHSYSGGSGSSGGGDSGGIGFIIYLLFSVLPPQISIPLVIVIIVARFIIQKRRTGDDETISSAPTEYIRNGQNSDIEYKLGILKKQDPNFSKVLFLDFAGLIFTKYYSWFGKKEFKDIAPYLLKSEQIKSQNLKVQQDISEIVIGSINISEINIYSEITGIAVDVNANFTVTIKGRNTRYAVVERWYFNRKSNILSQEPDKLRKLACPNCGSSPNFTDAGECLYCGTQIKNGEMQWFVKTHHVLSQEVFRTKGLGHYEQERGTNLPTIYQPDLEMHADNFAASHKLNHKWHHDLIDEVVAPYFFKIYSAWSENNLKSVRNLLSDRLHESFMFWIDAYKRAGLTNKLDDINIENAELVNVETDKFYDTLTFRIFASNLDYVVDKNGKVKGGSNRRPRMFSEYWTFMRKAGVEKNSYDFATCPNCGASATKIGQAGICEYCNSKISNGDYSWVLTIITQDEVYF